MVEVSPLLASIIATPRRTLDWTIDEKCVRVCVCVGVGGGGGGGGVWGGGGGCGGGGGVFKEAPDSCSSHLGVSSLPLSTFVCFLPPPRHQSDSN